MFLRFNIFSLLIAFCFPASAGNGMYFGLDGVRHSTKTSTETSVVFSPPPPDPMSSSASESDSPLDLGIRIGYKYKRRPNRSFYLAPEVFLTTFDSEKINYSTTLKMGIEKNRLSIFGAFGISRIEQFNKNELNLGLDLEYRWTDRLSFNIEWVHFDEITEDSMDTQDLGAQTLTITTHT